MEHDEQSRAETPASQPVNVETLVKLLNEFRAEQAFQTELLQRQIRTERTRFYISIAKYILWGVIIVGSFVFAQRLVDNMMSSMLGNIPQGSETSDLLQNLNLKGLLRPDKGINSQLQQELDSYY